jgi:hypothetical protein
MGLEIQFDFPCLMLMYSAYCSALEVKATRSSGTSVNIYQTTWTHISEDRVFQFIFRVLTVEILFDHLQLIFDYFVNIYFFFNSGL